MTVWAAGLLLVALALPTLAGCQTPQSDASGRGGGGKTSEVAAGASARASRAASPLPNRSDFSRPAFNTAIAREPWSYTLATGQTLPGSVLTSSNYRLHTTLTNLAAAEKLVRTLEAAHLAYREVAPTAPPTTRPMDAWIFAERRHWMDFTRRTTGADARLYLQITRGGYAIGDRFVSYFTAERDTMSVTAHEGFHQFVARHFVGRLPPFLEEGLACTFERVVVQSSRSGETVLRVDRSINPQRAYSLRTVIDRRATWPLVQLIQLHAGRIVGQPGARIEAFYSQSWAFARFLQEYDNARYLPAFRRLMADTVAGELVDPTGTHRQAQPLWDPAAVQPLLEHYLDIDLATLQRQFDAWCRFIAFDEFPRHWSAARSTHAVAPAGAAQEGTDQDAPGVPSVPAAPPASASSRSRSSMAILP